MGEMWEFQCLEFIISMFAIWSANDGYIEYRKQK
jgi:hypothetical protein